MSKITIPVQAWMLDLFPANGNSTAKPGAQRVRALANGLAMPSFWTREEITDAFAVANKIWARADIEFTPVSIADREEAVPNDEDNMWIYFINNLSPKKGVGVGFVWDLPANEGGWGGGRVAVLAGAKSVGGLAGFQGRLLAHELGHVLLGFAHRDDDASNLMFGRRHPSVMTADLLDDGQIKDARSRAQTL